LNRPQTLDSTNDLILKDSCPFKTSISSFPSLVEVNLAFKNLVKFFLLVKLFFNLALKGFSSLTPRIFKMYGYTKNLKQAEEEIGLPGSPKIAFSLPLNLANKIGLPGLIATPLKKFA